MRREATVKYFKLCRAKEEVARLNIEIRRLRTSIHDETIHTQRTISLLLTTNMDLAVELQHRWKLRNAVNCLHIQRLDAIENSSTYTGVCGIGTCLASTAIATGVSSPAVVGAAVEGNEYGHMIDLDAVDDDEAVQDGDRELENVTDFVLTIID